jgi:hypothetical protein
MKFNFTVDIDNIESLQDEIIESVSYKFIEQVLGNEWDDKSLYEKLEQKVLSQIADVMNMDFKNEVSKKVTENLSDRFEKTKQYKALINNEEIVSDGLMKTGLKSLVADLVKSEMKRVFKE